MRSRPSGCSRRAASSAAAGRAACTRRGWCRAPTARSTPTSTARSATRSGASAWAAGRAGRGCRATRACGSGYAGFGVRYLTKDGAAALIKDSRRGGPVWRFIHADCVERLSLLVTGRSIGEFSVAARAAAGDPCVRAALRARRVLGQLGTARGDDLVLPAGRADHAAADPRERARAHVDDSGRAAARRPRGATAAAVPERAPLPRHLPARARAARRRRGRPRAAFESPRGGFAPWAKPPMKSPPGRFHTVIPPSTGTAAPVRNRLSSLARNSAAAAISSGCA